MTPSTVLREATMDGVILSISAAGKVKAVGSRGQVDKWLPIIREHKISLVALLSEPVSETEKLERVTTSSTVLSDPANVLPDAQTVDSPETEDDRRLCTQCLNLRGRTCTVARLGGLVSARRGYEPVRDMLHRCAGYAPNATDADQRTGHERWPEPYESEGRENERSTQEGDQATSGSNAQSKGRD